MKNKIIRIVIVLAVFLSTRFSFCQGSFEFVHDTVQSHYLLWFHGHWDSKKKNTFDIKPAFGSRPGGTATVERHGNVIVATPSIDEWDKFFDQGLDDIDKWEQELTSHDYEEWKHHLNLMLLPQLESKKKEWNEYKIKSEDKKIDLEQQKLKFIDKAIEESCKRFKPRFDQIMKYYAKHRHDKYSDLKIPSPPEIDYTCSECDTNIEKRNEKLVDDYEKKFVQPEADMIKDLLPRMSDMQLLGVGVPVSVSNYNSQGGDKSLFDIVTKEFYNKNGACSYLNNKRPELWEIVSFLARHVLDRAEKLVKVYHKNFKTQLALTKVYCMVARSNALLGNSTDEREYFGYLNSMLEDEFYFYKHRLFVEHDWSQISNFNLLFRFMRAYQLLGGDDKSFTSEYTKLFKLINNFQLKIEMDIKVGGQGGYIITHLKGRTKIAPEFLSDSKQCYTWVTVSDQPGLLGAPVKQGAGKIHCDILDNEIVAPGPHPVYIGTKKYYTELKQLKMDFCHPGQDTILFMGFIPDPAGNGWWKVPESPNQRFGIWQTGSFFKDDNKIIQLSKSGAFQKQAGVMKQRGLKLKAQLEAMENKMKNGGSMPDIHKLQEMVKQVNGLANNKNTSPVFYIDFPLQIHNGSKTIFHKRFDAKQVNPLGAKAVIYGYMTIDISYTGK